MQRLKLYIFTIVFFIIALPYNVIAINIVVDIIGDEGFEAIKPGIEKSILTRCISRGIVIEDFNDLSVTISRMGKIVSYDAILDTNPPKAFHKDLKDKAGLSAAIDEMIQVLFNDTPPAIEPQKAEETEHVHPVTGQGPPETKIDLDFIPTSIVISGQTIFISDDKNIYILKDGVVESYWKMPGSDRIFRLYAYNDAIIILAARREKFVSYMIEGNKEVTKWNSAVVPFNGCLLSAQLESDTDLPDFINRWTRATALDGASSDIYNGLDISSALIHDLLPAYDGMETAFYNKNGQIGIMSGAEIVWSSETSMGITALFIENKGEGSNERFYMKPRILASNGKMYSFSNIQGMSKLFRNINLFVSSQVIEFNQSDSEFTEKKLLSVKNAYCADIVLHGGRILALFVKKEKSFVQYIDI